MRHVPTALDHTIADASLGFLAMARIASMSMNVWKTVTIVTGMLSAITRQEATAVLAKKDFLATELDVKVWHKVQRKPRNRVYMLWYHFYPSHTENEKENNATGMQGTVKESNADALRIMLLEDRFKTFANSQITFTTVILFIFL